MFRELFTERTKTVEFAREIADKTGLNSLFLQDWLEDNGFDEDSTFELLQAIGQRKLKAADLSTAVSGTKNNKYSKEIVSKFVDAD